MSEGAKKLNASVIDFRLYDAVLDVVIVVDLNNKVVYCNHWATNLCGLSEKRLASAFSLSSVLEIDNTDIFAALPSLKPFEHTPYSEVSFKSLDNGHEGRMQICVQYIVDGSGTGYIGIFGRDITVETSLQAKYQEKIREAQNLYEELEITQRTLIGEILKRESEVADAKGVAPTPPGVISVPQQAPPLPPQQTHQPPPTALPDHDMPKGLNLDIASNPTTTPLQQPPNQENTASFIPDDRGDMPADFSAPVTIHTGRKEKFNVVATKLGRTFLEVAVRDVPLKIDDIVVAEVMAPKGMKPFTAQCRVSQVMGGNHINPKAYIFVRLKFKKLSALTQRAINEYIDKSNP